ncbi:MAG: hypothetical protein WBK91_09730 [Alphaproteobacteria bacterium]
MSSLTELLYSVPVEQIRKQVGDPENLLQWRLNSWIFCRRGLSKDNLIPLEPQSWKAEGSLFLTAQLPKITGVMILHHTPVNGNAIASGTSSPFVALYSLNGPEKAAVGTAQIVNAKQMAHWEEGQGRILTATDPRHTGQLLLTLSKGLDAISGTYQDPVPSRNPARMNITSQVMFALQRVPRL